MAAVIAAPVGLPALARPAAARRSTFGGRAVAARPASVSVARRSAALVVRASKGSFDSEDVLKTLQDKWEATENKSTVAVYAIGALVAIWLSSSVVGAINGVPLLPKLMELVGLGYTTWFVYRYLLFKESRQELISDVEDLKNKISGADK